MKHYRISLMFAALCMVAASCYSSRQNGVENSEAVEQSGTTRTYNVASFTRIRSLGILKVHFSQSTKTSVKAVCKSGNIDLLKVKSHNGILSVYVNKPAEYRGVYPKVDLYVTAPSLNAIELAGSDSFEASRIETPWLIVNLSGNSKLKIDKIKAGHVKIETSGKGSVITDIEGEDLEMDNAGSSRAEVKFSGKKAIVANSGNAVVDLNFKGDNLTIDNIGITTMTATVDCKSLTVDNSGHSNLTLIGTADDTKIDNSGVSKVNTEQLNKY